MQVYQATEGCVTTCSFIAFLCSKHMSHTKAITAHVRSNHPAQLQEAIALGIQRMRQFTGNLSPCSFCMTSFNKTHLCPVFLQMAILELRAVTPDDPLHFTCFLCQFVAADRAQLKKHLTTLHQFPCHDWIPARDSLEDQVTCAHCGSVHHCQQALRKHITYGRCSQFDPARPWTGNGDADIVEQLPVGRIDLILADVEMKRRLTHDCQFCTQKFSQVSNLVGHLWKQRSELAEDGEQYRQVLRQRFAPRGCSCVPRIKQFRSTHTCVPFHQLSMIHFNGNALFNIPVVYDDAAARERMETHVPIRSFLLMHDALKTRDFELLQQDSTFRDSLSRHCLFCGKPVKLTGPAKEHVLRHHLQSMHPEPQQAIQCLIQMLIHRKGHDHLTTCDWCGVTIVPTHSNNEYDDHPSSSAFCDVAPHPFNSIIPWKSSEDMPTHRQRRRSSSKDAIPDVSTGAKTRERPELPPPTEHLRPLHVDRQGWPDAPDRADQQQLETTATESPSFSISTTVLGAKSDADSGPKSHQSHGMQKGGPLVAVESSKQDCASGFVMALSQMGPQQEVSGVGRQGGQHRHEGFGADIGANLQADGTARSHSEIPCVAKQDKASTSDPLAIGTGHGRPQAALPFDDIGELQRVATHPDSTEASSSTTVQIGRRPYEAHQEKVDRSLYCHILSELILVNDNVQCYVNATFLTIMWTHLMCGDYNMGSWGEATAIFLDIVKDGEVAPLCLRSHSRLQSGFAQWQQ